MKTPLVLIVYRRPDLARRVAEAVAAAAPPRVFIVADGPRDPGEADACRETLEAVRGPLAGVPREEDVAPSNLGCRRRVWGGLDWVFSQVKEAIILEDDCVPSPAFFGYSEALLERYRDDHRVMHIGGANYQRGLERTTDSYYFTKHTHCWGWATWSRAWQRHDIAMEEWPDFRASGLMASACPDPVERAYFTGVFDAVADGEIDSWAYSWTYSCWRLHGLGTVPRENLVTNVGFGEGATHTTGAGWPGNIPAGDLGAGELRHPRFLAPHREADDFTFEHLFGGLGLRRARTLRGRAEQKWRGLGRRVGRFLPRGAAGRLGWA